jgi:hypothetical protein
MTTPMKDRQNPNLLVSNGVIDSVELEPVYRGSAHIREPNSMEKR